MNIQDQVEHMIEHPYAFPGGYERIAITSDGGVLCHTCVGDNQDLIYESILTQCNDGWCVEALDLDCNTDEEIMCDHCGRIVQEKYIN